MLRQATFALALLSLLAGCASPTDTPTPTTAATPTPTPATSTPTAATPSPTPPSPALCPTDAEKRAAYAAAEAAVQDLRGEAFAIRLEGTLEGEAGTMVFAADPGAKRMRLSESTEGVDIRVEGLNYSLETPDVTGTGRDHNPGAAFDLYYDLLMDIFDEAAEDDGLGFADDRTVEDYDATCTTLGNVSVIEYTFNGTGGVSERLVVERAAPHRVLSGSVVDPPVQDNYRMSFAYEVPPVSVRTTLQRLPVSLEFEVVDQRTNERGGLYLSGRFTDGSQWAPLAEVAFQLVDGEGNVYVQEPLEDGEFDLEDGDVFTFRDRDDNGLLSTGDTFVMDLGPGLDIAFYDLWADAGAGTSAV